MSVTNSNQAPKVGRRRPPVDPQHWSFLEKIYEDYKEISAQHAEIAERTRSFNVELFQGNAEEIRKLMLGDFPSDYTRFGNWETYEKVEHILNKFVFFRTESMRQASEVEVALRERIDALMNAHGEQVQRITSLEATLAAVQDELAGTMNLLYMKEKEATTLKTECLVKSLKAAQLQRVCDDLQGHSKMNESAICKDMRILLEVNKMIEQENRQLRIAMKGKRNFLPLNRNCLKTGKQRSRSKKTKASTEAIVAAEEREAGLEVELDQRKDGDATASTISLDGDEAMVTGRATKMQCRVGHNVVDDDDDDDDDGDMAMATNRTLRVSAESMQASPLSRRYRVNIIAEDGVQSTKKSLRGNEAQKKRDVIKSHTRLEGNGARGKFYPKALSDEASESDLDVSNDEISDDDDDDDAHLLRGHSERKQFIEDNAPITALYMRLQKEREAWQRRLEAEVAISLSFQDHDANLCFMKESENGRFGRFSRGAHSDDQHSTDPPESVFYRANPFSPLCAEADTFSDSDDDDDDDDEVDTRLCEKSTLVASHKDVVNAPDESAKVLGDTAAPQGCYVNTEMEDRRVYSDSELRETQLPSRVSSFISLLHGSVCNTCVLKDADEESPHDTKRATPLRENLAVPARGVLKGRRERSSESSVAWVHSSDENKREVTMHQSIQHRRPSTRMVESHAAGTQVTDKTNAASSQSGADYAGFQGALRELKKVRASICDDYRALCSEMNEQFCLLAISLAELQEQTDNMWHGIEEEGAAFASRMMQETVNDIVDHRVYKLAQEHGIVLQRHAEPSSALTDREWMQNQLHDIILESAREYVTEATLGGNEPLGRNRNKTQGGPGRSFSHDHHQKSVREMQQQQQQQQQQRRRQQLGPQRHEVLLTKIIPMGDKQTVAGHARQRSHSTQLAREKLLAMFEGDVSGMLALQSDNRGDNNVSDEFAELVVEGVEQPVGFSVAGLGGSPTGRTRGAPGEKGVGGWSPSASTVLAFERRFHPRMAVRRVVLPCSNTNINFMDDKSLIGRRCGGFGPIGAPKRFRGNILEYLRKLRPRESPGDVENMAPVVYRYDFQTALENIRANVRRVIHQSKNCLKGSAFKKIFETTLLPHARIFKRLQDQHPLPSWILQSIQQLRVEEEKRKKMRREFLLRRIATNLRTRRLLRSHLCKGSALASFLIFFWEKWSERWEGKLTAMKHERCAGIRRIVELLTTTWEAPPQPKERRRLGSVKNPLSDPSSAHFSEVQLPLKGCCKRQKQGMGQE